MKLCVLLSTLAVAQELRYPHSNQGYGDDNHDPVAIAGRQGPGSPSTNQIPVGCNQDNCLRAMIREGNVDATPFCRQFTTAVVTDTVLLPTYASMCSPNYIASMSSACSCIVPAAALTTSPPSQTAPGQTSSGDFITQTVTVYAQTIEVTVTAGSPVPESTNNASIAQTSSTSLTLEVSRFSSSSSANNMSIPSRPTITVTLTEAPGLPTSGAFGPGPVLVTVTVTPSPLLPNTSSISSHKTSKTPIPTKGAATCSNAAACQASAACSPDHSCLCQPSVEGVGYCLADTPCSKLRNCTTNTDCGTGGTCMITCCSTHKCLDQPFFCPNPGTPMRLFARRELLEKDIPTTNGIMQKRRWDNPQPDDLDCQPDNCLREIQDPRFSSLASDFCPTYTTTINTEPTAIPTYLENCGQNPTAVSSACSCLMGPKTSTSPSVCAPLPTQAPLDCQPDNCLREVIDNRFSSLAIYFCASYTAAVHTEPSAIPAYLENCAGNPSAVSSACSCLAAPTAVRPGMKWP